MEAHRTMVIYGRNPVREALRGRRRVLRVWATGSALKEPWLQQSGVPVQLAAAEEIEHRCGSPDHQGICAEVSAFVYAHPVDLLGSGDGLLVALDQVQDPQNLGSICRTAECVGAAGVAIPERRAAEVTPAVCKASAGAVEHLRVARVRNLADFLADARRAGCWSYGAGLPIAAGASPLPPERRGATGRVPAVETPSEQRAPVAYDTPDYSGGVVLVLGSEGDGLRPRVAKACDELIALPLLGAVESLNVSAAAAALLYEILQNRDRVS
jgi:23S rRNA (guanosine2251-2'-O)-methyltransferase